MGKINAIITGVGGYVPDYVLNNEELSRMVDTNDEWITTRWHQGTAYPHRGGTGHELHGTQGGQATLAENGGRPRYHRRPHRYYNDARLQIPSTASIVLGKLGLKNAFAFDFEAACCGFLYSLDVASSMIASGRYKRIILIGADKMSSIVDYTDRATCVLFGDGAAVLVRHRG